MQEYVKIIIPKEYIKLDDFVQIAVKLSGKYTLSNTASNWVFDHRDILVDCYFSIERKQLIMTINDHIIQVDITVYYNTLDHFVDLNRY
jgi:hypothetical protein